MPQIDPHPRVVAKLGPADGKRTRYTFTGIKGLQLDCIPDGKRPLGNRVWRVRYYLGEAEKVDTLGTYNEDDREAYISLSKATELAAERRRLVKVDQVNPREAFTTFGDVFARWLDRHARPNKKSWRQDAALFGLHVEARLGRVPVLEVTRRDLIRVLDDIADKVSGVQANRCQALISVVLNWAEDEAIISMSPARGIKKRAREIARDRVLSDAELRAFWSALDTMATPQVARVLRLLLLTGLRLSEVVGAERREIDGDVWTIPAGRT